MKEIFLKACSEKKIEDVKAFWNSMDISDQEKYFLDVLEHFGCKFAIGLWDNGNFTELQKRALYCKATEDGAFSDLSWELPVWIEENKELLFKTAVKLKYAEAAEQIYTHILATNTDKKIAFLHTVEKQNWNVLEKIWGISNNDLKSYFFLKLARDKNWDFVLKFWDKATEQIRRKTILHNKFEVFTLAVEDNRLDVLGLLWKEMGQIQKAEALKPAEQQDSQFLHLQQDAILANSFWIHYIKNGMQNKEACKFLYESSNQETRCELSRYSNIGSKVFDVFKNTGGLSTTSAMVNQTPGAASTSINISEMPVPTPKPGISSRFYGGFGRSM